MNVEATLGEILAAALKRADDFDLLAQSIAGTSLTSQVADLLGVDASEVWDALTHVPDNMLTLLHSPQGWTALASYISGDLGATIRDYRPTIH